MPRHADWENGNPTPPTMVATATNLVSRFSNTVACRTGSYRTNGKTRAEGGAGRGTKGGAGAGAKLEGGAVRKAPAGPPGRHAQQKRHRPAKQNELLIRQEPRERHDT